MRKFMSWLSVWRPQQMQWLPVFPRYYNELPLKMTVWVGLMRVVSVWSLSRRGEWTLRTRWESLIERQPSLFDHRERPSIHVFLHLYHQSQRVKVLWASNISKPNPKPNPKHLSPCKPEPGPCISDHSILGKNPVKVNDLLGDAVHFIWKRVAAVQRYCRKIIKRNDEND